MFRNRNERSRNLDSCMRHLNRIVLAILVLFLPLYVAIRFVQNESIRLDSIEDVVERIKEPIVCSIPEKGVRYVNYYKGKPDNGNKFVLVDIEMQAKMKIGFCVVPKCFRLVDDHNVRHYPRTHSPFFVAHGDSFYMDRDEMFIGTLLFEIPAKRKANNLLFDRYHK